MPRPKDAFDSIVPCEFYDPEELLEAGEMYTVYEIARLLQDVDPDTELDPETENVLLDWTIPWVMMNAEDLVVADAGPDEPGYYGLRED